MQFGKRYGSYFWSFSPKCMSIFRATKMPKVSLPISPKVEANKSLQCYLEFFKKLYDDYGNVKIFPTNSKVEKKKCIIYLDFFLKNSF